MIEFNQFGNHPRVKNPAIARDIFIKECLDKYLTERDKLLQNKKIDTEKLFVLESQYLRDDFDYWVEKRIDRSFINQLIKLYKDKCKKTKTNGE